MAVKRAILAAVILLLAQPCVAQPSAPLTDSQAQDVVASIVYHGMTDRQIETIKMTALASFAGDGKTCPRYHLLKAEFAAELQGAGISQEMLATNEFKNALAFSWLGPTERFKQNPSDFCLAAWQVLGPNGQYRRQMLEAK